MALYVDLRKISPVVKRERFDVIEIIGEYLQTVDLDRRLASAVVRSVRSGHLAVVFDGFDEHASHLHPTQASAMWRSLASVAQDRARVMITCRTHFFADAREET